MNAKRNKKTMVKFDDPSTRHTIEIETIRMYRDQALTLYVENVRGQSKTMHGAHEHVQIEIRVLPNGQIEVFHDCQDPTAITLQTFDDYKSVFYEDFGF